MRIDLIKWSSRAFDDLAENDIVRLPESQGGDLAIVIDTGFASMRIRYITGGRQGEAMTVVSSRAQVFDLYTLTLMTASHGECGPHGVPHLAENLS